MLQEIFPNKLNNHYDPSILPTDESYVIAFRGSQSEKEVLINPEYKDDEALIPRMADFESLDEKKLIYLFSIGEELFFLLDNEDCGDITCSTGYSFVKFYEIRRKKILPQKYVFSLYTAYHLNEWYESSRFCGRCGSRTVFDKVERAKACEKCGTKIYPRINPAVIIGVTDKESNKLILTKYRRGFAQNALVAGFTEIGETLEETVKREVMEEVGLTVENVRYYKSQPWGIAADILAGFYCDVVGSRNVQMDESELKYAEWVAPDDIVLQEPDYSLTNEMMRVFKEKGYKGTIYSER